MSDKRYWVHWEESEGCTKDSPWVEHRSDRMNRKHAVNFLESLHDPMCFLIVRNASITRDRSDSR